jgi:hypothetical protein
MANYISARARDSYIISVQCLDFAQGCGAPGISSQVNAEIPRKLSFLLPPSREALFFLDGGLFFGQCAGILEQSMH